MNKSRNILLLMGISAIFFAGCGKDIPLIPSSKEIFHQPEGFPKMEFPDGNEYTKARWELGKALFYDPILSKSGKTSCSSCHKTEFAFADNAALSLGDENQEGTSNSPTLANIGYHPYFTRAGGVPTLEMQVLVPIQEHNEFNNNIVFIADTLKKIPFYVKAAQYAYKREPDAFVITRALANFERSLISGNSKYDQFIRGNTEATFNAPEMRGWKLFNSDKTNCSKCHSDFGFSNYNFENNGLYEEYADGGRFRITQQLQDIGKFKVPTLRNIAFTAPYMHDGSFLTLEEVVEHYDSGGKNHTNKSVFIKALNLSAEEKSDLIAFLKSLSDFEFLTKKEFKK